MSITIGVFDSGFGGLTVLRELCRQVPDARYIYLGDTARLPYGSKSRETIVRYAISSARFLEQSGAERLVIACNTATALALEELKAAMPIPVLGVVEPGTRAAAAACQPLSGSTPPAVLVLATQATVDSHAYARACAGAGLMATEKACPLLVPLVEEGWVADSADQEAGRVTRDVVRIYLREALEHAPLARALLLGCTHYPLLQSLVEGTLAELGHTIPVIDSAHATAQAVAAELGIAPHGNDESMAPPECQFFATDSVKKFARLGTRFLARPVQSVQLVDLGG